ncbi:hypothetical protein TEA_002811 [Camellia sinensis var. sinensis]|uniref:Peptidase M41 domain-containing protein n=1 Tax=Camellia sinensis var. sinensis TaxID=542762 RepID=A0A4S4DF36_CAMSN|nr:hypothetical protein TEA_002811 [Camellia sinensis var. sinensis]
MNLPLHSGAFHLRHEFPANGTLVLAKLKEPDAVRRRRALRRVDRELSKGNHKAALTLVKQLQGKPGGLRGFGSAKQVHRRISSLDELKLSGIDISYLQSLVDSILNSIERSIEFQLSEPLISYSQVLKCNLKHLSKNPSRIWTGNPLGFYQEFCLVYEFEETMTIGDSFYSIEGDFQYSPFFQSIVSVLELKNMMHSGSYESLCEDHLMCMQHEAGHFLVGYLLGVLPKGYKVSNMEALRQEKFARGRVEFLGFEFLRDDQFCLECKGFLGAGAKVMIDTTKILQNFSKGKLFDGTLNKFLCVILGGLAAEQLVFGYSEGLHSDVEKLNRVLKWLGFTKSEADSQVKWAAVNTLLILVRHQEARSRVAEAMALGKSVGSCIDIIENTLIGKEI